MDSPATACLVGPLEPLLWEWFVRGPAILRAADTRTATVGKIKGEGQVEGFVG
jgi:hypothetical protein